MKYSQAHPEQVKGLYFAGHQDIAPLLTTSYIRYGQVVQLLFQRYSHTSLIYHVFDIINYLSFAVDKKKKKKKNNLSWYILSWHAAYCSPIIMIMVFNVACDWAFVNMRKTITWDKIGCCTYSLALRYMCADKARCIMAS